MKMDDEDYEFFNIGLKCLKCSEAFSLFLNEVSESEICENIKKSFAS